MVDLTARTPVIGVEMDIAAGSVPSQAFASVLHRSVTYTVQSIWRTHQKSRLCDTQSPASNHVDNFYDSGRSRSIRRRMYTSAGLPILAR